MNLSTCFIKSILMELLTSDLNSEEIRQEITKRIESSPRDIKLLPYLTAGTCLVRDGQNPELENLINRETKIISDYRSEKLDESTRDLSNVFPVSMELWIESISRMYSSENPIRGYNIVNSYIESNDPELSIRYIRIYKENFLDNIYRALQIKDENILQYREDIGSEKFEKQVLYGSLLVCVWHKINEVLISEKALQDSKDYIMQ